MATKRFLLIPISIFIVLSVAYLSEIAAKRNFFTYEKTLDETTLDSRKVFEDENKESLPVSEDAIPEKSIQNKIEDDGYKSTMTTLFWIGEEAGPENKYIPNDVSAWDIKWVENFGGIDEPSNRCGYNPCSFTPKENPFYFALPYFDFTKSGVLKESAKNIDWYEEVGPKISIIKNRWIEVRFGSKTCYGQWQDVGPLETDDFEYVFGDGKPKNTFGVKAGLDISPALWQCLELKGNSITSWRFIEEKDVPPGPWMDTVTESGITW